MQLHVHSHTGEPAMCDVVVVVMVHDFSHAKLPFGPREKQTESARAWPRKCFFRELPPTSMYVSGSASTHASNLIPSPGPWCDAEGSVIEAADLVLSLVLQVATHHRALHGDAARPPVRTTDHAASAGVNDILTLPGTVFRAVRSDSQFYLRAICCKLVRRHAIK